MSVIYRNAESDEISGNTGFRVIANCAEGYIMPHLVILTNIDWMIDFFLCLYYNIYKRIQRIPKRRRYYGKENHYHQP